MSALRGVTSWLVAAGLVAPVACEDERTRPNDVLEGGEGEGEGEPISPFACGASTYECREGQECVEGICRTPEGREEQWCKNIVFVEWSKNFYLPVDQYLGDQHEREEGRRLGGSCVRSDFFDFTNLQMRSGAERPFLWGTYKGNSWVELYFNKASTIDQRKGETFAELKSSDFYEENVCGGSNGMFFDVHNIPEGLHVPWMRTTLTVLPEVGGQPANFFVVRAAFFATELGETQHLLLGTKIDDNQGGPVTIADLMTEEEVGELDVAVTGDISPTCEFLEIGAYHERLSPGHDIRELRVYLQPLESVGLSALEVWSCACDEEPEGDVVRPGNF